MATLKATFRKAAEEAVERAASSSGNTGSGQTAQRTAAQGNTGSQPVRRNVPTEHDVFQNLLRYKPEVLDNAYNNLVENYTADSRIFTMNSSMDGCFSVPESR